MRDPCNRHLDNFYMIVPALLVNHVDHMLAARDELAKHRGATIDAAFTDDGVAVGRSFMCFSK